MSKKFLYCKLILEIMLDITSKIITIRINKISKLS